ncbi:hypothetical protein Hypma_004935 [Hypsizygus marmoreus]|uniref:Uncharacterized protein n=1 Tax=Hypsizygus marmoreus TaxID=39966 RepID=A0A369JX76_HYPMA|nr:hypothetical protein Hypma_004935 [Hypsizygus marmoreus]
MPATYDRSLLVVFRDLWSDFTAHRAGNVQLSPRGLSFVVIFNTKSAEVLAPWQANGHICLDRFVGCSRSGHVTTRKSGEVPASAFFPVGCSTYINFDINLNEILAPAASGLNHFRFLVSDRRHSRLFGIMAIIFDVNVNQVLPPAGSGNTLLLPGNPRERLVSLSVLLCRSRGFRRQIKSDPAPRGERKHSLLFRKPPPFSCLRGPAPLFCHVLLLCIHAEPVFSLMVLPRGSENLRSFVSGGFDHISDRNDIKNTACTPPVAFLHSVIFDTSANEILAAAASGNTAQDATRISRSISPRLNTARSTTRHVSIL